MGNENEIVISEERKLAVNSFNIAAQIVFCYLNGYSCQSVKVNDAPPIAGITAIDYKEDAEYVENLLRGAELEFFAELKKASKLQAIEAAEKLAKIIVSGTAAEAIYENGGYIDETLNIKLHFLDLMKVQYLNYILTHIDPHHSPDFIKQTIDEVLMLMSKSNIWQAIDSLAGNLRFRDSKMNQQEIEDVLHSHNILATVNRV